MTIFLFVIQQGWWWYLHLMVISFLSSLHDARDDFFCICDQAKLTMMIFLFDGDFWLFLRSNQVDCEGGSWSGEVNRKFPILFLDKKKQNHEIFHWSIFSYSWWIKDIQADISRLCQGGWEEKRCGKASPGEKKNKINKILLRKWLAPHIARISSISTHLWRFAGLFFTSSDRSTSFLFNPSSSCIAGLVIILSPPTSNKCPSYVLCTLKITRLQGNPQRWAGIDYLWKLGLDLLGLLLPSSLSHRLPELNF